MTIVKITKEEQEAVFKAFKEQQKLEVPKHLRFTTQDVLPGQVVYTGNGSADSFAYAYQPPEELNPITVDHPAMQATLDELSNLWAAKFGDTWVQLTDIAEDAFWAIASSRLSSMKYLEYYNALQVYRLCK